MLYLYRELYLIVRKSQSSLLRICVTGTRGKSSVTRLIASVLKEGGYRVMAKTTGSRPVILFPDGQEEEIKRRGLPSILEQKKILSLGRNMNIDALVSEMMSIRPETAYVESVQILKPQILVVTNVRLDHLAEMGTSRYQIARSHAASIPRGCTVFIPQNELLPVYTRLATKMEAKIIPVCMDSSEHFSSHDQKSSSLDWEENTRLALAVADYLKLDKNISLQGIKKVPPDFGGLKMWRMETDLLLKGHLDCLSCFAANDPESTRLVLSKLKRTKKIEDKKWVGLLNLRRDRGDRTLQWVEAVEDRMFPEFERIYLVGGHALAFHRKFGESELISLNVLRGSQPEKLISQILQKEQEDCILIGMGNIGGAGRKLVEFWEKTGSPHDL